MRFGWQDGLRERFGVGPAVVTLRQVYLRGQRPHGACWRRDGGGFVGFVGPWKVGFRWWGRR